MRCVLIVVLLARVASAAPGWNDVPALVGSATAPIDADLKACTKQPARISIIAARDAKSGTTHVSMPVYGVGFRGLTRAEKCQIAQVAKISLPDLPAGVERVILGYPPTATGKQWDDWRDLPAALALILDDRRRAALAACDAKPRNVRIVLDLSHGKTRVWLPAWQFHSPSGDGSTPSAQQKIKVCLTKAIASWQPAVLPGDMGELEVELSADEIAALAR